jgi:hypothetical protein
MKMKVITATIAMPSPPPACDDGPGQTSTGLTLQPVMSTGMRGRMAMIRMWMRMRRKKHHKSMMDQRRMLSTERIVLDSVKIGL